MNRTPNYESVSVADLSAAGFQSKVVGLTADHATVEFSCRETGGKTQKILPRGACPVAIVASFVARHGDASRHTPARMKVRFN